MRFKSHLPHVKESSNADAHVRKIISDVFENLGLVHAGAKIVDAWGIDDSDALSTNLSLNGADLVGTRAKTLSDPLLLRRDVVDELFRNESNIFSRMVGPPRPQRTADFPTPDCPKMLRVV